MSQLQSSVGLISGLNITQTVNNLMAVSSGPVNALTATNTQLQSQDTAFTQLSAQLLALQADAKALKSSSLYTSRSASSSDSTAMTATVTGTPSLGTYQFTPLQVVQTQQLLSNGFSSDTTSLGGGQISFRFGANLDQSAALDTLNGGAGFTPGKIQITDRSGATATIDLSTAQTIGDVINDINNNGTVNVTASADGNHLVLTDNTGKTGATAPDLKVQEVGNGSTAASLGLAGIDVSGSGKTGIGSDILSLSSNTSLSTLNDGAGVLTSTVLPDIGYTLSDGTTGKIDFSPAAADGTAGTPESTLGQIVDEINAAAPGKLQATIDSTTHNLVVTDQSGGSGAFTLTALNGSQALHDLGLDTTASGNTVTGRAVLGGLQSPLLSSLNGGQGYGQLGTIDLTDRSGATATVNLSGVQTLSGVIDAINQAGIGIKAQVNAAANGIQLVDTTGATTNNMIVANDSGDAPQTATKLGIAVNGAVTTVNSGDMHLQVVSLNTQLSSLNGGAGVAQGTVNFTDSNGKTAALNVTSSMQTVGDVINAINLLGLSFQASINTTGDGILLTDTGGGNGTLSVSKEFHQASDLNLLQTASKQPRTASRCNFSTAT